MKKFKFSRRKVLYHTVKLAKQSGTPECIARGVFWGVLVGWVIPFGFQLVVVIPLAIIFKANKLVACAATFVNNHLTVFVMSPFQCWAGSYMIGHPLHYGRVRDIFMELLKNPSFGALFNLGTEIFVPFFVGGTVFGVLTGVTGYFLSLYLVRHLRGRKDRRNGRKEKKIEAELQNRQADID